MPGDGIEAVRQIRQSLDAVKIVILTASENADHFSAALRSGVNGYVLKGSNGAELLKVVRAVQNLELYLTSPLIDRDSSHLGIHDNQSIQSTETTLTCREELTLTLLSQGLTNGEIAQKLDLTETTIKHFVFSICQKLSVRNRVEAMLTTRRRINWGF
jgi:DNA-binding NarL/FixJ family response regulator